MGAWQRSGWVTEYPGRSDRDTLVDFICAKCGTRIGVPDWQADDKPLLTNILRSARCKCKGRNTDSALARRARDKKIR